MKENTLIIVLILLWLTSGVGWLLYVDSRHPWLFNEPPEPWAPLPNPLFITPDMLNDPDELPADWEEGLWESLHLQRLLRKYGEPHVCPPRKDYRDWV